MTKLIFVEPDNTLREVNAENGVSLMSNAVNNSISGIVADCGGAMACGTCHVYVDPAWIDRIPAATEEEKDMLDAVAAAKEAGSRLSCQIQVSAALEGLIVRVAPTQY